MPKKKRMNEFTPIQAESRQDILSELQGSYEYFFDKNGKRQVKRIKYQKEEKI